LLGESGFLDVEIPEVVRVTDDGVVGGGGVYVLGGVGGGRGGAVGRIGAIYP